MGDNDKNEILPDPPSLSLVIPPPTPSSPPPLEISLVSQQLTIFPPLSIFPSPSTLQILKLDSNSLTYLPSEFHLFTSLKILFLGNNLFTTFPKVLSSMPSITMLSFKNNYLTHLDEEDLSSTIQWLILTNNSLRSLPSSIGKLRNLKKLMLANNKLTSLPSELSQCQELELIRLSSNKLTEIPSWLLQFPCLSWIALAGNPCFPTLTTPYPNPSGTSTTPNIPPNEMFIGEKIGEGASGIIYKADSHSLLLSRENSSTGYAIKFFKDGSTSDGNPLDEQNISLSLPSHSSLVPVLGTIIHPQTSLTGLILPLIPSSYISLAYPPSFSTITRDVYRENTLYSYEVTLEILASIASCCSLLHSRGIMHGDLYAHNILIHSSSLLFPNPSLSPSTIHSPYLVDFGAATCYQTYEGVDRSILPLMELVEVRAYSVLFQELLSRTQFQDVNSSKREELQELCDRSSAMIVTNRPNFQDIMIRLQEIRLS